MTEQAVQDLVQRIAQMEVHLNIATERAAAAENRSRAAETAAVRVAGVRQGTVPTALVDTRLLGKPRTFSGALAELKPWRLTFTAYAGALSLPRHEETDGESSSGNRRW